MSAFLVICPTAPGRCDGVADYACWLTAHLAAQGSACLVGRRDAAMPADAINAAGFPAVRRVTVLNWRELWAKRREPPFAQGAALLQYVPQLYLPALDFAWLLLWLIRLRVRGRRVVVTVHEYAVPASGSLKRAVARLLLNLLMVFLGGLASHLVVTFDLTRRRLRRLLFWKARRIVVVPVGSNIPAMAVRPQAARGAVVCTIFGQPEAMSARLVAAIGAWRREARDRVEIRWIARSRAAVQTFLRERCGLGADAFDVAERQTAAGISRLLASSDLCLAPIADGVSTRRTTVMAALAHALPIVGTDGICTDDVLRQADACRLSAAEDGGALVRNLEALVTDADRRRRMSRAARTLFEERFTWDRIAGAYVAHLSGNARAT